MPTYVYRCRECQADWDVVKPMSQIDRLEDCPACGKCNGSNSRQLQASYFTGASDWNTQTWNPGLGCYTKSDKHARDIAKGRGLIEVGNEKPETLHKMAEETRKATREQRWKDAEKVKVYDD